jgi:hypothetical protein
MPILRLLSAFVLIGAMRGHAQDIATLTLLKDTPLRVIRGVSVLQGVEGMRIRQGDYLETGPGATAQAQLEFTGGATVELGPSSQVLLFNATASSAEIVVTMGWLKGETTSGTYRYDSPVMSATTKGGNVLLHIADDESDVFVETGVASINSGGPAPIASSAEKIFFTRRAGKPLATAGRPSQEFVGAMPVSFRDVLPPRLARFSEKKPPEPKSDHEVSYSEIERLLRLPPAWRRGLVDRFRSRLRDPGFRQAIESHLSALPEWKPVLSADNQTSGAAPTDKSDPR